MIVGFDRKIRSEWLDETARLAAQGLALSDIRQRLEAALAGQVAGEGPHSARGKTRTVLLRIWVTVPDGAEPLRDEGLAVVANGMPLDLRPLHWGMCLATHPFFRDVAAITGRLLSLQGSVALSAVTRRVTEAWGARSTVLRASQRVVRSMVDWGALRETERRGVFRAGRRFRIGHDARAASGLGGWLVEAALLASGRQSMRMLSIARHPMLFSVQWSPTPRDVMDRPRLELLREGAGEDVVGLTRGAGQPYMDGLLGQ